MEKDFYYGEKYFYENRIIAGIKAKFFFFNFEENLHEQLDFVQNHAVEAISLTHTSEENVKAIFGFLENSQHFLRSINLQNINLNDVDFLYSFPDLEDITLIVATKSALDFSKFKKLTSLNLYYDKHFCSFIKAEQLRELTLHKFNEKQSAELSSLKNLKHLEISQSKLKEIDALQQLNHLESLSLKYFPALENIEPVTNLQNLRSIHFQNCKKVQDWQLLGNIQHLESIILENCQKIESLAFLKSKPLKKVVLIGDTNILDGDLNWLLQKESLINLNFPVLKHYSLKPEELWAHKRERNI